MEKIERAADRNMLLKIESKVAEVYLLSKKSNKRKKGKKIAKKGKKKRRYSESKFFFCFFRPLPLHVAL